MGLSIYGLLKTGWVTIGAVLGLAAWAQVLPPAPLPTPLTPWICVPPTVPGYTKCDGHPEVNADRYPFRTGCYDIGTGLTGDCRETWILYFSTEGVAEEDLDYWTGAHLHSREAGDHPRASIGEIQLDFMAEPSARSGEWQTEGVAHNGSILIPEASGVSRAIIYYVAPRGYKCVPDETWVRDPADTTCRACMGTFLVEVHVEGLEPLPESEWYEVQSNPHAHTAGSQFHGTPEMNKKLADLAKQYVQWYQEKHGDTPIQVSFNDLSLPWGGIYDYDQTSRWDCPHALHRVGRSADVNTRDREWLEKWKLDILALQLDLFEYHKGSLIHYEWE